MHPFWKYNMIQLLQGPSWRLIKAKITIVGVHCFAVCKILPYFILIGPPKIS